MEHWHWFLRSPSRGSAMIGLLIVIVIILIVIMIGPFSTDTPNRVPQAVTQIDRAAEVACKVNRGAIKTDLVNLQMMNPGVPITIEILAKKASVPQCPRGGAYVIGPDGVVYCTKHFPPPPAILQKMVSAGQVTPVPMAPIEGKK